MNVGNVGIFWFVVIFLWIQFVWAKGKIVEETTLPNCLTGVPTYVGRGYVIPLILYGLKLYKVNYLSVPKAGRVIADAWDLGPISKWTFF